MAATGDSTGLLTNSGTLATVFPPMTLAAWINLPNASGSDTSSYVWQLLQSTTANIFNLHFSGAVGSYVFGGYCHSFSGTSIDGTAVTNSPVGWHHVAATFPNSSGNVNSVALYIDGVLNSTTTTGGPVTSLTNADASSIQLTFGNTGGGAPCTVAYPAMWNIVLTGTEIANLAAATFGNYILSVESGSLASFAPLQAGNMSLDTVNGSFTITGTVTNAADPFPYAPSSGGGNPVANPILLFWPSL